MKDQRTVEEGRKTPTPKVVKVLVWIVVTTYVFSFISYMTVILYPGTPLHGAHEAPQWIIILGFSGIISIVITGVATFMAAGFYLRSWIAKKESQE